ncbi:unnamed protein product (macronuclear) [Paramecium tetraurelia]|uniref:Uncharacterized protein n=1 Tax=Paramecium tetraurelia TaxID=5888 RepID=A0EHW4_PARTE|nr:uncharacterized protein GSPATT00027232001 [Paramecium tetraurelia]CAK94905.1 unnamed protein product [Paramecium tetraurelia]|eukprot:XP_001462278.1 hypothetical protein (macronuclear) [Paramecium tetraurelia strain d4-2]
MSIVKRQFSNGRMKSDADVFKQAIEEVERKRPGSGQPMSTVKSPLPPRKPLFSGSQKQRLVINANNNEQQIPQQKIIKSNQNSQHSSKASLSITQNQQQLLQIKSPQKQAKPPIRIDKKIIIARHEQIGSSGRPAMTGDVQSRNNSKQKVSSAGTNTKQFNWTEVIDVPQRESSLNKRRLVSREKLQALPQQYQTHQQQSITQSYRSEQNTYHDFEHQLTKSVENKQPLCYTDFSMTSKKNDLSKALASIKLEIKQASQEAKQNQVDSYMNAIPEQEDDGCSSLAQSTLYQFK